MNQQINGNINLKYKRKPLDYSSWSKRSITKISDLWDGQRNKWKVKTHPVFQVMQNNPDWETEYARIKRALPQQWYLILKNLPVNIGQTKLLKYHKALCITHNSININGKECGINKFKAKDLYYHILYPQKQPNCTAVWNDMLQKELNWSLIFKSRLKAMQDRKRCELHWKIIHRAIYTESRLSKMGRSDGLCKICNQYEETTSHLFYECNLASSLWEYLTRNILCKCNCIFIFTLEDVLFGCQFEGNKGLKDLVHFLALELKWQLWKNRNNVKYGNKQSMDKENLMKLVLEQCSIHFATIQQCHINVNEEFASFMFNILS